MTNQAELKKCTYSSDLKSRALSILIYLIDRSNKDLTCFPAIPTMAEQLHISVSTVKRALHELVSTGFIQKDTRFRDNNRGQTSNLYTLVFKVKGPTPGQDSNPDHGDHIEPVMQKTVTGNRQPKTIEHITFADIATKQDQTTPAMQETMFEAPQHHESAPLRTKQPSIFCHRPLVHSVIRNFTHSIFLSFNAN